MLMVLSSISPLFILWAIRGNSLISDHFFVTFCVFMVLGPYAFLLLRIRMAKRQADRRELTIGKADDHRDHILVYLFAMLLPLYAATLGTWRDFGAVLVALVFIIFLFWHLNLHYTNLLFALLGYRIFTVYPPVDGNPLTGRIRQVIITRRVALSSGERLIVYRLSDTVYMETTV